MAGKVSIPRDIQARSPLMTAAGFGALKRMLEHPDAPRWNHVAGDKLVRADLKALDEFRAALSGKRRARKPEPPASILQWLRDLRDTVPAFRKRVPDTRGLKAAWADIPTMSREDIAIRPEQFVPDDADLRQMIIYRTAGTTGHALLVPHAARAAAMYQPLLELAWKRYGIVPEFGPKRTACFLVGAQAHTVTYPTALAAWKQAGFAKLNLRAEEWPGPASTSHFFETLEPMFLTGDPISFSELLRLDVPARPAAMISTAVAMSAALKKKLQKHFGCPVIDWYSLTETGPLGYACPAGKGYHQVAHDIYMEAIDEKGRPVAPGKRGEIAVTGGRNPYLPLLRYRTGDWGRMAFDKCECGDPMPRLLGLEGRAPVLFRNAAGGVVNPVDVSGALRRFPLVQHEFTQLKNLRCDVRLRPIPGMHLDLDEVAARLGDLFGSGVDLRIELDPHLGDRKDGGKVLPFRSEFLLED